MSSFSTFEYRNDVQLLKRLAAGTDPVPDLLVTGKFACAQLQRAVTRTLTNISDAFVI